MEMLQIKNIMASLINPRIMAGAAATIISGIGIDSIFKTLPVSLVKFFAHDIMRFVLMVLLVWQSGQSIIVSLVVSAITWLIIMGMLKYEQHKNIAVLKKAVAAHPASKTHPKA